MRYSGGSGDSRDGCYCLFGPTPWNGLAGARAYGNPDTNIYLHSDTHVNHYAISERNRDSTSDVNSDTAD
jgi:hypothetical protein